ncbi:hypothetical protein [Methylotuvimicrobium sp. KM1]|uniref:hypothetical protein n=1 Tax=Methylotuvimicrobium sp. KM1 TaxID=3377707 RepID=UPI00384DBB68
MQLICPGQENGLMAPLRGAIGSDKELEHVKTTYSIKRNAINQIKQALGRSLSDPLKAKETMELLLSADFRYFR